MFIQWQTKQWKKVIDAPQHFKCKKCGKQREAKIELQYKKSEVYWGLFGSVSLRPYAICTECGTRERLMLSELKDILPEHEYKKAREPTGFTQITKAALAVVAFHCRACGDCNR